jgi:hypothetical protein
VVFYQYSMVFQKLGFTSILEEAICMLGQGAIRAEAGLARILPDYRTILAKHAGFLKVGGRG